MGAGGGRILGPVRQIVSATIQGKFVSQRVTTMLARVTRADLDYLRDLIESGKVRPSIDRTFPFEQAADAFRLLETRHAQGKIVITLE